MFVRGVQGFRARLTRTLQVPSNRAKLGVYGPKVRVFREGLGSLSVPCLRLIGPGQQGYRLSSGLPRGSQI